MTDLPTLPNGWAWATVEQVGKVQLGRQRSPKHHDGPHMRPYLRVANVFEDRIDTSDVMSMNFEPEEFERYRLLAGDVLLNEGQSPELLGRPALYRGEPADTAFTNTLIRFQPEDGILPEWALIVFRRHMHFGRFTRESRITTNIAHLSANRFKTVEFPVPPTEEQRRIAEVLDVLLNGTATVAAQLNHLERSVAALRNSVLRGFLPRDDEPTTTIGEVSNLGSGATPAKGDAGFYSGGRIPWLTSGDLNTRVLTHARQFITERALRETAVKVWPASTLLVAMYGEGRTRGRAARLDFPATTNQACAAIRLKPDAPISLDFLHGFFDAAYNRNRLLSAGGVQPNLSLKVIREISVPLRSPKEQEALVATYEAFLERQAPLLNALANLRARLQAFERRLLAQAFAGHLVPQAACDEPAELLVKRIAEDRQARDRAEPGLKRTVRNARTNRALKTEEKSA